MPQVCDILRNAKNDASITDTVAAPENVFVTLMYVNIISQVIYLRDFSHLSRVTGDSWMLSSSLNELSWEFSITQTAKKLM